MAFFEIKTSSRIYKMLGAAPGKPVSSACDLLFSAGLLALVVALIALAGCAAVFMLLLVMGALLAGSPMAMGEGPLDLPASFWLAGVAGWMGVAALVMAFRVLCKGITVVDDRATSAD
ncbi:hypothetical protein ACOI1H_19180 [Loktanella sp. DJP18]|uniref:hypothetical protein n=1 Tax=Loktanella sp. DJP18 TaxID=3409788 RepID=UPI003BB4DBB8